MRAGKLRNRFAIQAATQTTNSLNEKVDTWATVDTVWGEIVSTAAREGAFAKALIATATHGVRIRYYAGLNNRHRLVFGSRVFSIDGIDTPNGVRSEMLLACTERANVITH